MKQLSRRRFLELTSAGLASVLLPSCAAEKVAVASRPNILYINIDDLGWSDMAFMGSQYYDSPNVDQLAKEGVIFTHAYAPGANCAPSRACCMSGQYPPRHGIYTVGNSDRGDAKDRKLIPIPNQTVLNDDNITIAEALKDGGYDTCFIGKWHLGDDPRSQGFDVNIGGSRKGCPNTYFSPYHIKNLADGVKGEYLTDRLTNEAISYLEQHQASEPFFMYLAYYTVHWPWEAKEETINRYEQKEGNPQHNSPVYAAMIKLMDDNIGRLMKRLETLGLKENTLVLFTSDNGGVYGISRQWPLRAGKGAYYEGGIRVPMIVRWPGKIKPGRICDTPASGIDFYPTFLEAADVKKPEGKILDGVSLMPLVMGKRNFQKRPLFWHFPIYLENGDIETQDPLFRTRPGSAVRYGDWKLIEYFENGDVELYNLKNDPGEKKNLAEQKPQKTSQLLTMLRDWRERTNAPVPTELNPEYDVIAEK